MKERVVRYSLRELCEFADVPVPAELEHMADKVFKNVANAPRYVKPGGVYFATGLYEPDEERRAKIKKAIEEGVGIVFVRDLYHDYPELKGFPCVFCPAPFRTVLKIAADIRRRKGLKVIGITGSLGKTTTKDFVFDVMKQHFSVRKSLGNQNTIFPILDNLQKVDSEYFVQEFGAATPTVMPLTVSACIPDIGIITNISEPHLDVFGSKENILKEKIQMITQMPAGCPAFLNYDDEMLREVKFEDRPIISYAVKNTAADYYAENIRYEDGQMVFEIVHGDKKITARLNIFGEFNVSNAVVAAAIGDYLGMDAEDIVKGLAEFKGKGTRQNLTSVGGYKLYIDCYNSSPVSLPGAVEVIESIELKVGGRRIAVLGDMAGRTPEVHTETGKVLSNTKLDLVLCYGNDNAKIFADEIGKAGIETRYTDDRDMLDQWVRESVTRDDIVLFKGPTTRFLVRTIDQVFGTSYQLSGEKFEFVNDGEYRCKIISEKEAADKKTVALLEYRGVGKKVKVPSTIRNEKVFAVGPTCFKDNETITNVNIPAPIYNISRGAFRGCRNLKKVDLPATLKIIENRAFKECESLEEVILPKGVTGIGDEVFYGCKSLKAVYIPETVAQIGENAFAECPDVKLIRYKDSYTFKRFMQMDGKKKIKFIKRKIKKLISK